MNRPKGGSWAPMINYLSLSLSLSLGMNAAVVLLVLLLAVPLQLFLSHYLNQAYAHNSHTSVEFKGPSKLGPTGERAAIQSGIGTSEAKGIEAARTQAVSK